MYFAWLAGSEMHSMASHARSWFSELAPTPRLMPPSGGADGVSASTRGQVVQAMSSITDCSTEPSATAPWVAE